MSKYKVAELQELLSGLGLAGDTINNVYKTIPMSSCVSVDKELTHIENTIKEAIKKQVVVNMLFQLIEYAPDNHLVHNKFTGEFLHVGNIMEIFDVQEDDLRVARKITEEDLDE